MTTSIHTALTKVVIALSATIAFPVAAGTSQSAVPASASASAIPDLSGIFHIDRQAFTARIDGDGSIPQSFGGWPYRDSILRDAPLAKMRERDAALNAGTILPNNTLNCIPDGTPAIIELPYEREIVQTADKIYILYLADYQQRVIHLNATHPKDVKPSFYGHSIGHYEGDTLVIDTIGLSSRTHMNWDGIPHSEKMRVIERYRLASPNVMELLITIEDPEALKAPWTFIKNFKRENKRRMNEYVCAENVQGHGTSPPVEF